MGGGGSKAAKPVEKPKMGGGGSKVAKPAETPKMSGGGSKAAKPAETPKRNTMGEWTREEALADIDSHLAKDSFTRERITELRPYHETSWNPTVESGVKVGDPAPDAKAVNLDGSETSLHAHFGDSSMPVILCFGSVTCPPFRLMFAKQVMGVADAFTGRVRLQFIYIKEAHPTDEWSIGINAQQGVARPQCVTVEDRISAANKLLELQPGMKDNLILDTMANELNETYAAMSSRLYVVHKNHVVYQGHVGPYELSPESLKAFLVRFLADR